MGLGLAGRGDAALLAAVAMYDFTTELGSFAPPRPEQEALFAALARRQADADRFLGALTGTVPLPEFFAPRNRLRILGVRGLASMALRGRRPVAVG